MCLAEIDIIAWDKADRTIEAEYNKFAKEWMSVFLIKKILSDLFEKIKESQTSTKIMIALPVISVLIFAIAPSVSVILGNRITIDGVRAFASA